MKNKIMRQVLIDMPFSLPESPAFGLSQIKSYLAQEMPMEVETSILYLCHDFYQYFGEDIYQLVNKDFYKFYKFDENKYLWVDDLRKSGLEVEYFGGSLGEWIFRQEAFPEAKDNTQQYFSKYYINQNDLIDQILNKRKSLHEQLMKYLIKYHLDEYDVVGFTCRFQQLTPALSMARLIKERSPNCVILMGGPSLEPPAGASIAGMLHPVDYVLSGRRFLIGYKELLQSLIKRDKRTILSIPGVFSKEKNGLTSDVDLYEASAEDDINTLLQIDYDDYFQSVKQKMGDYNKHRVVFLETSRGCSWGEKKRCSFCSIDGYNPKHRFMTSENAISYIQSVFDKYKEECKYYVFVDSTLPKHYLYEVFPYLVIPENATLLYEARADFTKEEIKLMAKYHIRLLIVGIESFSSKALKLLNKGKNAFDNIRFLKDCRQYGIAVNWNILVGIPGETDEMIHDNIQISRSLSHLYPPTGVWLISFQGNCDYTIHNQDYNMKLVPDITSLAMVYPFPNSVLEKTTYFYKQEIQSITKTQAVLIQRLSKTINCWKDRWFNADFNNLPGLYFNDKKTIIDTRQGNRVVIRLDTVDYEILSHLNEPLSLYELKEKIQIQDFAALEHKIKILIEYGLIFTERGLYLSLVTEKYEMETCREQINYE